MVRRLAKPASFTLAILSLTLTACEGRRTASIGDLEMVVPTVFSQERNDEVLSLSADESIGIYRPRVSIILYDHTIEEAAMRSEQEDLKKLAGIQVSALEQATYGGQKAWSYSMRFVDAGAHLIHNRKPIEPSQVDSRKVSVLIPYAKRTYSLEFRCPEKLYEKYRPEFDALLRSLKFKG